MDGSPPGSPIPEILQARTLEWVAISFSNAWKWKVKVKLLSHVRLLATPWTACSLAGSSVHGVFQARVLEWGAIAFSLIELVYNISFQAYYTLQSWWWVFRWLLSRAVKGLKLHPTCVCACARSVTCNSAILWTLGSHQVPPGSSVPGIFLVRLLEWGAMSYSRGSSLPRDWALSSCIGRILYHCATWETLHPT